MRILCLLLCLCLLIPAMFPEAGIASSEFQNMQSAGQADTAAYAMQAAEILGVEGQVRQLLQLQQLGQGSDLHCLALKALLLKKILLGALEVNNACNKFDTELTLTYDIIRHEEIKLDNVNGLFNLANFLQFGTLYSLEGKARLDNQFTQSSILTCISSGVGIALPTLNLLTDKFSKTRNEIPPKFMAQICEGSFIDEQGLSPHITRFMDSAEPGKKQTRRQEMYALWLSRYGIDYKKSPSLCSLNFKHYEALDQLNKRLVLLWTIHTFVQGFDSELLALLNMTKLPVAESAEFADPALKDAIGAQAYDAASLLDMLPQVSQLIQLNKSNSDSKQRRFLETYVLERLLEAGLERRLATNKVDAEINYAHDVVLSQLLYRRGKELQLTYDANFVENGVFGSIAGLLYLKNQPKAGNEMFVISSSIGTFLSTVSLLLIHGGWKKRDTPPNSLAAFMGLGMEGQYQFPAVVARFLSTPDPQSASRQTRRDELYDRWKEYKAATMNIDKQKNREKVAGMPSSKYDTIKIVSNRVGLLRSVKNRIEALDPELFELLKNTQEPIVANENMTAMDGNKGTADLIHAQPLIENIVRLQKTGDENNAELIDSELALTRKVMLASLEEKTTISHIDLEIIKQSQFLGTLSRQRNLAVALINNLNFYQINILGIIIDGPLGLSSKPNYQTDSDILTVVSGITAFSLGCAAFLAHRGGFRLKKAEPNLLSACFGIDSPANKQYSPLLLRFLNSAAENSTGKPTRFEELVKWWKDSKLLNIDVTNPQAEQKLAAIGSKHHCFDENIKLIRNRLTMLFDLRAAVNLLDTELTEILGSV